MIENLLGFIYNFCFVACYWPQIIKSLKTNVIPVMKIERIIAGAIIRAGDLVIDGSARGKLIKLADALTRS